MLPVRVNGRVQQNGQVIGHLRYIYGLFGPSGRSRWLNVGQVLFFFCVLMDRDGVEVHKLAEKE